MTRRFAHMLAAGSLLMATAAQALAWDAHGHRTITLLALDTLAQTDPTRPAFLATPESREMAAFQSSEPDRYRAVRSGYLKHENDPDHYIDVEDLVPFGLTLETVPKLRYEYLRAMAIAKHEHPDQAKPYNEKTDFARTQEFPGYGLHAVMEHHAKLIAAFKTYRILMELERTKAENEAVRWPAQRPLQVKMTEANILAELGHLSHFVGDLAQPLHTTTHHHGWVGDNPKGYTTDKGIHAYIDGEILKIHTLNYAKLGPKPRAPLSIDPDDAWNDLIAYVRRSFEKVEPLYLLKKTGDLEKAPGEAFIEERLLDAGSMLGAMYATAWKAATPSERDVKDYLKYDGTLAEPGDSFPPAKSP